MNDNLPPLGGLARRKPAWAHCVRASGGLQQQLAAIIPGIRSRIDAVAGPDLLTSLTPWEDLHITFAPEDKTARREAVAVFPAPAPNNARPHFEIFVFPRSIEVGEWTMIVGWAADSQGKDMVWKLMPLPSSIGKGTLTLDCGRGAILAFFHAECAGKATIVAGAVNENDEQATTSVDITVTGPPGMLATPSPVPTMAPSGV